MINPQFFQKWELSLSRSKDERINSFAPLRLVRVEVTNGSYGV